ncbi:MAG: MMPL family transporter [Polyangiaceae bacterium]|nr:MMPL family transporter [Polyangiaceae bacterium]
MKAFARFIVRRSVAWVVVVVVLGLSAAAALYANRVVQDDDILAFLPRSNPEVDGFYEVSERFGSMDVALVGIETDDVFQSDFLQRLQTLTKRLNETNGIEYALSITSVEDFAEDKAGGKVELDYLVREMPTNDTEREALREKVLSRDHIVGTLVSKDGRGVMLYCFATPGVQPRVTAKKVSDLVNELFPKEKKYWGGAPFISTYIYDVTQNDLKTLAPFACLAIALIVLLSFRDLLGTGLSLLSTLLGIVIPLGIMGFSGVHTNIVLGSMPVILFALGSAYGVHLLTRFYSLAQIRSGTTPLAREEAMRLAIEDVGPSILGSGLTTVFGLLSFVMMDIKPMRTFGIYTALGLTVALVLAMTFIPAVIVISPVRGRVGPTLVWVSDWMARLSVWVQRNRLAVGIATVLVVAGSTVYASRVDSRMDTAAFFDEGSPPDEAFDFMQRDFGGAQFIQIQVEGDMTDPAVLRELQLLGDRISTVEGVSSVQHVASVIAQINEAMGEKVRRIPDTADGVRQLYSLVTGKRIISQTITDDRKFAMMHVKVMPARAVEVEAILREIERITAETLPGDLAVSEIRPGAPSATSDAERRHRAEIVAAHVGALAVQFGTRVESPDKLRAALEMGPPEPAAKVIEDAIVTFMKSDAFDDPIPKTPDHPDGDATHRIAKAVAALGAPPSEEAARKAWRAKVPVAIGGVLEREPSDGDVDNISVTLEQNVPDFWTLSRAKALSDHVVAEGGLAIPEGPRGERLRTFIGHSLLDLDTSRVLLPPSESTGEKVALKPLVTGLPVLYRGLSQSVFNNQWNSLWFALVLVIGLKALLFRSLSTGLLSSIPTLLTLLVMYGGMGLIGVHLDIGTSMLASLIIGAGDDYAVQYLWSWSVPAKASLERAAAAASMENGAGIWTNAIMVAIGFFVLTLGDARPLQNVGGLTAAAMIAAALATFIICPLLARRRHYAPVPAPVEQPEEDPAIDSGTPEGRPG